MKKSLALVLALIMVLSSFSFVSAAPDFSDVKGTIFEEEVARLELLNVLKGYPDGTFKPEGSITRAEFAAVAVRARGLAGVAEAAKGLPSGFIDVPATHWAAGYVGTAGSMGIVNGIGNGMFAPNGLVKYEEAVTMLVRALGYEYDAQTKGGYPFGYLIVAEEIGLLDGARGTQGTFATRGLVALLTDNALEIPMMIQDGTGEWIVSGANRTAEKFLLDFMGFDTVTARVLSYDSDDMEVELEDEGDFTVAEGTDLYAMYGATIKAWVDGDEIVVFTVKDDVLYDAVDVTKAEVEIKLVEANKKYDVDKDAIVYLNNAEKEVDDLAVVTGVNYDFAKVVLNDDGDVVFMDAWNWDDYVVVEEIEDFVVYSYGEEIDMEDYLIVKGGATIAIEDVKVGDILFFEEGEAFAEVYNKSITGEIEEVFTTEFTVEGKDYDIAGKYVNADDELVSLTSDALEMMMDEEKDVVVFFERNGDVAFVSGDLGVAKTSNIVGIVVKDSAQFSTRGGYKYTLDIVTEAGERVDYDITAKTDVITKAGDTVDMEVAYTSIKKGEGAAAILVKVTVDEDGDVTKITELNSTNVWTGADVKTTARYLDQYRLTASTVLFMTDNWNPTNAYDSDDNYVEVIKLGDADFDYLEADMYYVIDANQNVDYIVVENTDRETDIEEYTAIVIGVSQVQGSATKYRVTMLIDNVKRSVYTDADTIGRALITRNDVAYVKINEANNTITEFIEKPLYPVTVANRSIADGTFSGLTLLDNSFIYDWTATNIDEDNISFRDIVDGDTVWVATEYDKTNNLIKYVFLKVDASEVPPVSNAITMVYGGGTTQFIDITAPTNLVTAEYAVRIKTESSGLPVGVYGVNVNQDAIITDALTDNVVYTAELIKIAAPTVVLASYNFVAEVTVTP